MPNYQKNQLLRHDDRIIRVLTVDTDVLTIDCLKRTMPQWMPAEDLQDGEPCDESALPSPEAPICNLEDLTAEQRKVMHERYTLIAPVLPFIHKESQRSAMITQMAELNSVSKQTIRKYLCLYLTYQRMEVLAPPAHQRERELSDTERNFRWALNKFYYTQRKHSLPTAYNLMLKEKYTDATGQLIPGYILTKEMVSNNVALTANAVWQWSCAQPGANLIPVDARELKLTLLPRTEGKFTRRGLVVHKQRYRHCEGKFTERYLNGGKATVAYDPNDISSVYLYESGLYTRFELILKVYDNLSLEEVMELQAQQQAVKKSVQPQKDQALIDLVASIETIANTRGHSGDVNLKGIRQTHKTEKQRRRSKQ